MEVMILSADVFLMRNVMKQGQYKLQTLQYMERFQHKRPKMADSQKTILFKIIDSLCRHKCSQPFLKPVDYVSLGLPDYPSVITQPMDLETVRCKLRDHKYKSVEQCLKDLLLIWENCRKYNHGNYLFEKMANEMESFQHKTTKNYLPSVNLKRTSTQLKEAELKDVKVDNEPAVEQAKIETCKTQQGIIIKEDNPIVQVEFGDKLKVKQEKITVQTNLNQKEAPSEIKTQQHHSPAREHKSLGQHNRQIFLRELDECNDCEATLLFMLIKRRCSRCLHYDSSGNSIVNLLNVDDYTLALALNQIKIWKNKALMQEHLN